MSQTGQNSAENEALQIFATLKQEISDFKKRVEKEAAAKIEESLQKLEEELEGKFENRCWLDAKKCQRQSEIKGFLDIGIMCNICPQLAYYEERIVFVLEEILTSIFQCLVGRIKEKADERSGEAWERIADELEDLREELKGG